MIVQNLNTSPWRNKFLNLLICRSQLRRLNARKQFMLWILNFLNPIILRLIFRARTLSGITLLKRTDQRTILLSSSITKALSLGNPPFVTKASNSSNRELIQTTPLLLDTNLIYCIKRLACLL
ncbi:hypothetical protein OF001_U540002 [Pseudomonas sp. OF001]|nr:hypothetical protein OF001_U540002 [Pseudomonas sp. OF001]